MAERIWTVKEALDWTIGYFTDKGVENPRRSAEWLLSAATDLSRLELYAYHDRPLSPEEREQFREGVRRRAEGEPLQYVTGEVPFRHLVLKVVPGVFIPRPETESLVEEGLDELRRLGWPCGVGVEAKGGTGPVVVDLCTGSGAVAVSVAHECPDAVVHATELSEGAVRQAVENACRADVSDRVLVAVGDLFAPLEPSIKGAVTVLLSNPPYIPTGDLPSLPREVGGFEPRAALDGGPDGLDVFRRIASEAPSWLVPGGVCAAELDEGRCRDAADILAGLGYSDIAVRQDLAGRDRLVVGRTALDQRQGGGR